MSRTEKIPSLDAARQARADDVRNALATVALRARTLAASDETWENAAEVLNALTLALSSGDAGAIKALAKMADRARTDGDERQEAYSTEHKRELKTALQAWDGENPEEMADRFLSYGAQNLALKLRPAAGETGDQDPTIERVSYTPEAVRGRVAKALAGAFQRVRKDWIPGNPLPKRQGENLVAAGLRALGADATKAASSLDQRLGRRKNAKTLDR